MTEKNEQKYTVIYEFTMNSGVVKTATVSFTESNAIEKINDFIEYRNSINNYGMQGVLTFPHDAGVDFINMEGVAHLSIINTEAYKKFEYLL